MPRLNRDSFQLEYEERGTAGEPIVLVHDRFGDRHQWDPVATLLAGSCRVLSYDRRGHGASTSPGGSLALAVQVDDLSTLLSVAGRGARHVVGTGVGGVVALQLALTHPDQVRSLHVHEPHLVGMLSTDPSAASSYAEGRGWEQSIVQRLQAKDGPGAARAFVDGSSPPEHGWSALSPASQAAFASNAPVSLRESLDPTLETMDIAPFGDYRDPVLVTGGSASPAVFGAINDRLAEAFFKPLRYAYDGAGHFPHLTHPELTARVITDFCRYASSRST